MKVGTVRFPDCEVLPSCTLVLLDWLHDGDYPAVIDFLSVVSRLKDVVTQERRSAFHSIFLFFFTSI